jgi:STE24 endopeptidase
VTSSGPARVRDERVGVWAALAVVLALAGAAATIWRPTAPSFGPVRTDLDAFDPTVLAAVEAYRAPRAIVVVVATIIPPVVPLVMVVTPWGRRLVARIAGDDRCRAWRAGLVALAITVTTSLVMLPLAAWIRLVHDARWAFRTQSAAAWARDWTLVSSGRAVLVTLAVVVAVAAVRRWPRSWPYRLTVGATTVAALGVMLHPVLLLPVTLPLSPLTDVEQRAAIDPVLAAAGEPQLPVYVGEESRRSTRVNALATGLGPTARVIVYDNLLELPPDQVASIVAHEVAHHQHRDLPRGVLLVATAGLPALLLMRRVVTADAIERRMAARGPGDPRMIGVVLLVVAVLGLASQPVVNLVTRQLEAAADARAVEITGDPSTLIASTRVFTVRDLADPDPPPWIHVLYRTHPSVGERVRQAVAIAERDGLEVLSREQLVAIEADQRHPAVLGPLP